MKSSIMLCLGFVVAMAILMATRGWSQNSGQNQVTPVIVHTKTFGLDFNYPPSDIRVDASSDAMDRLRQAVADPDPLPEAAATIDDLVTAPEKFALPKNVLQSRIVDFDLIVPRLEPLLSDETISSDTRFNYARILTALGVRAGFDWGIDRFGIHDEWDDQGVKQLLFYTASKQWLEEAEAWSLLKPRLGPERYGDRSVGEYCFPEKMLAWYIGECENPKTEDAARLTYFRAMAGFAPTVKALESCESLFKPGPEAFEDWNAEPELAELLQRYVDGGAGGRPRFARTEPEVEGMKSFACRLAMRVAGHRHWKSQQYHRFICANGGEEFREYFERNLAGAYYRHHAFEALVRLAGDDAVEFLRRQAAGFPGQEKHVQDQATKMLAERLIDLPDPDFVDSLVKSYHSEERWSKKLVFVNRLYLAGATDLAEGLRQEVAANAPDVYFRSPLSKKWNADGLDVHQFLADLQSQGLARSVSVKDVSDALMPQGPTADLPHPAMISHDEYALKTLELAGLRASVDTLTDLESQLHVFSDLAQGEFDIDFIHIDVQTKTTSFRFRNQVCRYDVDSPEEYQDPIVLSMIANSLLKQSGLANRFLTYDDFDGMSDINFFYGSSAVAKMLVQKYSLPFLDGSLDCYETDQ